MFGRSGAIGARVVALAVLLSTLPGGATAQGLTARVAPEAASYRWGESVGLDDAAMFGGGGALGFGRYVLLRSTYTYASSVPTRLQGAGYGGGPAGENSVRVSFLSTDVQLRLGTARIAPIVMGGGGVLGLSPQGRDRVQQVAVSYGAGVDANLADWLNAQVLVRDMRFRLDRAALTTAAAGTPPPDVDADGVRSAVSFTAALGARVGGARRSSTADRLDADVGSAFSGGDGLMIPVELQAGVVRFADAFALGDQSMAGLRAGVDFGPYFGLRGSYALGLGSGVGSFASMSTWSGEAQFNVGRVTGVSPHLLLGFGQMNFWGDARDENGLLPDDRDVLILGAGIGVPVGDRVRFIVSLRDYVTSAGSPSSVSTTSDLRHSFGLSTGLAFDLRGRRARPGEEPGARGVRLEAPATTGAPNVAARGAAALAGPADSALASRDSTVAAGSPATAAVYQSDRIVSLPLPTQGELYIRYGPTTSPGAGPAPIQAASGSAASEPMGAAAAPAADEGALAELVRREVAAALASQPVPTSRELQEMEARIADRISSALAARGTEEATSTPQLDALTRQVEELAREVRARDAGASQPVVVSVAPEGSLEVVGGGGEPFLRGGSARVGTHSVRDSGRGVGASADVLLGGLFSGLVHPFVGVEAGRSGVRGGIGGSAYVGHVTSYGGRVGVALDLPRVRSIAPAVTAGLVGIGGGVSGNSPFEESLIDDLYGGFVMGPRVSVEGAWIRDADGRWSAVASLARTWAGARGGWSFQVGVRWLRRGYARELRPLFVRSVPPAAETEPPSSETGRATPADSAPPTGPVAAPAANDSLVLGRLDELQSRLDEERRARLRSEAAADSLARSARAAAARADSLAAIAAERDAEAAERDRVVRELTDLVGVVEGVQAVRISDRGLEVILGGSLFPTGGADLTAEARLRVQRVARVLARVEGHSFIVDGHTDSTGSAETNLALSQRRADAVRAELVGAGIAGERVVATASGETSPIAGNETPQGRALNRRVEIVVVDFSLTGR